MNQDIILEEKTCKQCTESFKITQQDRDFYTKISPTFGGKKYIFQDPQLCHVCRQQNRLSFKNERKIYKNTCKATGKSIVSKYHLDSKMIVYSSDFWWSDNWDALEYGLSYTSNSTFFDQFIHLQNITPVCALGSYEVENADYNNDICQAKDCYYSFSGGVMERVYYTFWVGWAKDIYDGVNIIRCENMYESVHCVDCSFGKFLFNCQNCSNSIYLYGSIGCRDCIASVGLENKQYCMGNKQYSKEEYSRVKESMSYKDMKDLYEKVLESSGLKNQKIILESEDVSGNYIKKSKNIHNCFHTEESEDSKNIMWGFDLKDSCDCDYHNNATLVYNFVGGAFSHSSSFCVFCNEIERVHYSRDCYYCKDCFGCVGLRNKQYCILNKQYSKEDYFNELIEIISTMKHNAEWGEFFPNNSSPFGYNESLADTYYPLSKQEALKNNFNWSDYEAPLPKVDKIIPAHKLPEDIEDIPDDILNWAIECEVTKKPFRIIRQELEFYRKHNLPVPKRHPDQRHLDRMKLRNPRKLYTRNCDKCEIKIQTTYAPERPEKVYCEACYNSEIY